MWERVLLGIDDTHIRSTMRAALETQHYDVKSAVNDAETVCLASEWQPDAILLWLSRQSTNSVDACRQIRRATDIPLIVVEPGADETRRVVGLEVGADAYLPGPIDAEEMLARVRATLRAGRRLRDAARERDRGRRPIQVGELVISSSERLAWCAGRSVALKRREFDLLAYMAQHRGGVLTRDQILSAIWDGSARMGSRTVDTHVQRLRAKLTGLSPDAPSISTVRGLGYVLR